ncbi:MAG: LPP20 family lipoprotein [bacterium]
MKKVLISLIILAFAFTILPASLYSNSIKTEVTVSVLVETTASGDGTVNWGDGTVRATGTGVPPTGVPAPQARLMAKRAAVADAYRLLAEAVNGVKVDAETLVKNYVTESDTIKTKVSALVKGAKIVDEKRMSDGSYEVTMEISMYGDDSLADAVLEDKLKAGGEREIGVNFQEISGEKTGLIIDARGLKISPAMSPKILDEKGKELFGTFATIDADYVVANGIVDYAASLDEAKKSGRAGSDPMIIKGVKAGKDPFKANVIVKTSDADDVKEANSGPHFLEGARVVIVI